MIPQGGGDHHADHRCAGEWLTVDVMKAMLRAMVRDVAFEVPGQDLTADISTMLALPKSGFVARIASVGGA